MTWDPNVQERTIPKRKPKAVPFDIDTLDDGRCKASSWRGPLPNKPMYHSYFGPGGFNRCSGPDGHVNHLHRDEWGNVFRLDPFRVVRREPNEVSEPDARCERCGRPKSEHDGDGVFCP